MNDIDLQNGTVRLDEEWLTTEDLQDRINLKMKTGELKFGRLAMALERLVEALEQSTAMDIDLTLSREDHARLLELAGGGDPADGVRRAIEAFVAAA